MANVCSSEGDPRPKLASFVSDPTVRNISGNRTDGLDGLMDLVREEVLRQEPGIRIVNVDRDFLSAGKILFARDLASALLELTFGVKSAVFIDQYLSVIDWQEALAYLTDDVQVYYGSLACRQIPVCVKLL